MFFRKKAPEKPETGIDLVERLVANHLPDEEQDTRAIVVAIAGLLAGVAYADRSYGEAEQAHVREALGRIHALSAAGADAICAALRSQRSTRSATRAPCASWPTPSYATRCWMRWSTWPRRMASWRWRRPSCSAGPRARSASTRTRTYRRRRATASG